jgi:hypothetical protein
MRVLIFAALLLGSSSLCPSFAQEQGKPAVEAPQTTVPGRTEQKADQPRDQRTGRDPSRADDREMGPDWRMRRGDDERFGRDEGRMRRDGDRMGRDDREMDGDQRMPRDRDGDRGRYAGRGERDWDRGERDRDRGDRDRDRGQSAGRGDRDRDYADRDKDDRSYFDEDRPRRRVKICIEYDNGDEYCRYQR